MDDNSTIEYYIGNPRRSPTARERTEEDIVEEERRRKNRLCYHCGSDLKQRVPPVHASTLYCDYLCSNRYKNYKRVPSNLAERACLYCNRPIEVSKDIRAQCCDNEHAI